MAAGLLITLAYVVFGLVLLLVPLEELGHWHFLLWFVVAAGLIIYLKILTKRGKGNSSNDQGAA